MKKVHMKKIQKMLGGIKCPKNFKCAESGFESLCKAQDFGHEFYLECFERKLSPCPFELSNDYSKNEIRFCTCPLRIYLARKLRV